MGCATFLYLNRPLVSYPSQDTHTCIQKTKKIQPYGSRETHSTPVNIFNMGTIPHCPPPSQQGILPAAKVSLHTRTHTHLFTCKIISAFLKDCVPHSDKVVDDLKKYWNNKDKMCSIFYSLTQLIYQMQTYLTRTIVHLSFNILYMYIVKGVTRAYIYCMIWSQ